MFSHFFFVYHIFSYIHYLTVPPPTPSQGPICPLVQCVPHPVQMESDVSSSETTVPSPPTTEEGT